jgi:hypothetical protein
MKKIKKKTENILNEKNIYIKIFIFFKKYCRKIIKKEYFEKLLNEN